LKAFSLIAQKQQLKAYAAINIAPNEAIADSGATQIFVMEGTPVLNKGKTRCPLKVVLADGSRVLSMHMCDIVIPGLPTTLVGHIVPELSIASLFGIRVLTEAGCMVKFDNIKCVIKYNGKTILVGMKDPRRISGPSRSSAQQARPPISMMKQSKTLLSPSVKIFWRQQAKQASPIH
jgi:hypothetical protein